MMMERYLLSSSFLFFFNVAEPLDVIKIVPVGEPTLLQIKACLPRQDDLGLTTGCLTASGAFKDERRELISCRTAHLRIH